MKMKKFLFVSGLMILSLVFTGISYAATLTGSLQVTATVGSVCSVSTTAVNFGAVTGATNATGDVTVSCPTNTPYKIALDAGQNYNGIYYRSLAYYGSQQQKLIGPFYGLYKDDNSLWGDNDFANTYPLGSSLSDTGSGNPQSHTVHGWLDNFTGIPVSTVMSDTVTVTVHY